MPSEKHFPRKFGKGNFELRNRAKQACLGDLGLGRGRGRDSGLPSLDNASQIVPRGNVPPILLDRGFPSIPNAQSAPGTVMD